MRRLLAYLQFIPMGFKELVAYRVAVLMLAISVPIVLFSRYYMFAALYREPQQVIEGYSITGIFSYVAISWLMRSFFRSNVDRRIGRDVRNGDILLDLMRPLDFHFMMFFRGFGKSLNRLLFVSMPLILLLFITDLLPLPTDPLRWAAFFACLSLGYVMAFELQFMIGIFSFYTGYNINLIWTFDMVTQLMAGLIVPIHFFPEAISKWLAIMPFRHIYYTPVQVFMGQIALSEVPLLLINATLWIGGIGALNYIIFHRGSARMSIAGG